MPVKKFAISVPVEVMDQVDLAAAERGVSRSRFISDMLRRIARARTDAAITRQLDEVFGDPAVAREQQAVARAWLRARKDEGTQW